MLTQKKRKSKKGAHIKLKQYEEKIGYEAKEVFVGNRTIFSVTGFVVGGILIGRSLWEYGNDYIGLPLTIVTGVLLILVSGVALGHFHSDSSSDILGIEKKSKK
ncbi:hypothetical protein KKH43_00290 [Patescibacteria group bacterium]|nr:hypothetical protein [Patescibacteria group bacterium]